MATTTTSTLFMTIPSSSFTRRNPSLISLRPFPATSKLFGLDQARGGRVTSMAVYKVELRTPGGPILLECPDDVYIMEWAEEQGIDLPYSCRSGSCSSCAGKVIEGVVDQDEQSFLDPEQMDKGFVLTCIAYPRSNLIIETHKEDAIM